MNPYYLMPKDPFRDQKLVRNVDRAAAAGTEFSAMISAGALHAVEAIERGWRRMNAIIGR